MTVSKYDPARDCDGPGSGNCCPPCAGKAGPKAVIRTYEPISPSIRGLWQRGQAPSPQRCRRCDRRRVVGSLHIAGDGQADGRGVYIGIYCQDCAIRLCQALRPLVAGPPA